MKVLSNWRTECLSTALRKVMRYMPRHISRVVPGICSGEEDVVNIYSSMMEVVGPFLGSRRICFEVEQ